MKKDNRAIPIHPLQPDCGSAFRFHSDGSIEARSGSRSADAEATLVILGLNDPGLQHRRRKAIEDFLEITQDLSPSAVELAASSLSARDLDGHFVPFASAVLGIFLA